MDLEQWCKIFEEEFAKQVKKEVTALSKNKNWLGRVAYEDLFESREARERKIRRLLPKDIEPQELKLNDCLRIATAIRKPLWEILAMVEAKAKLRYEATLKDNQQRLE